MIIDNINLNHLRIFEYVYRTKSMTKAAQELHMTQSGVSQHIKHLEDILEIKLFDRIKQRLIPTEQANYLFKECSSSLYNIEKTLNELKGVEQVMSGTVHIGVPVEFGNNLVVPLLTQLGKTHPKLKFNIKYGLAPQMNDLLLNGVLDFAFVDSYGLDKHISTEVVFNETLVLCASPEYLKSKGEGKEDRKYFEELDYVDYSEENMVLNMWFNHHFKFKHFEFKNRAIILDVQGLGQMIKNGLGAGVLPLHVVKYLEKIKGPLHIFKGSGKPLLNAISVAYLSGRSRTPTVNKAFEFLVSELKKTKLQ